MWSETIGTEFLVEVFFLNGAGVEEGDDDRVYNEGAEFFHEIEGEGRFTVFGVVEVANVGV